MDKPQRYRGYVIGQDMAAGVLTWKVCVTDKSSPYLGEKIFVASASEELPNLEKGLEVTFYVGAFGGSKGSTYYKAIDVALAIVAPRCDFCSAPAEILMEVCESEDHGNSESIRCCLPHIARAVRQGQASPIVTAKTKMFLVRNFAAGDSTWRKLEGVF